MLASGERDVGAADADPDPVRHRLGGPGLDGAIARDRLDLEAHFDARSVGTRVAGGKIAQNAATDFPALGLHPDGLGDGEIAVAPDVHVADEQHDALGRSARRDSAQQENERERQAPDRGYGLPPGKAMCGACASARDVELEVRLFPEAQRARNQDIGKRLRGDVQIARGPIVVAARHLQLVLDLRELGLQVEKILVGLELRIGFRHRHQPVQRSRQCPLRRRLSVDAAGRNARGAPLGHFLKDAAFVCGISLHSRYQIGDEVGPPAQLHVDAAPALAHEIAQADEPVEDNDRIQQNGKDYRSDDPFHAHCGNPQAGY